MVGETQKRSEKVDIRRNRADLLLEYYEAEKESVALANEWKTAARHFRDFAETIDRMDLSSMRCKLSIDQYQTVIDGQYVIDLLERLEKSKQTLENIASRRVSLGIE